MRGEWAGGRAVGCSSSVGGRSGGWVSCLTERAGGRAGGRAAGGRADGPVMRWTKNTANVFNLHAGWKGGRRIARKLKDEGQNYSKYIVTRSASEVKYLAPWRGGSAGSGGEGCREWKRGGEKWTMPHMHVKTFY